MANEAMAIGLMILLFAGGVFITFNLTDHLLGINMGIGFDQIHGAISGFWIVLLRIIVAPILSIASLYVIVNLIKQ